MAAADQGDPLTQDYLDSFPVIIPVGLVPNGRLEIGQVEFVKTKNEDPLNQYIKGIGTLTMMSDVGLRITGCKNIYVRLRVVGTGQLVLRDVSAMPSNYEIIVPPHDPNWTLRIRRISGANPHMAVNVGGKRKSKRKLKKRKTRK